MRRRLRINQIVSDFAPKPLNQCRILDIASLEGGYSAEFAKRGAEVLGVEGRQINIERAKARHTMPNLKFVRDDVRNISREKYGEFDIVLCLGILYHLDAPECFKLLELIGEVCTGFAIIDTHFAIKPDEVVKYNDREYHGWRFIEYDHEPTEKETEETVWASIGNRESFWMTKPSLVNAIVDAGFNSVYESQYPAWNDIPADRVAMIAVKGAKQELLNNDFNYSFDEEILNERVDETPKVPPVAGNAAQPASLKNRIARKLGLN